jgi:hypothetical protein
MLSGLPSAAGRREWLVAMSFARILSSLSARSIQSTSVRGVMIPRTARSPSRSTPEIILRSSVSIAPEVSASATKVLISSSVMAFSGEVCTPRRRKIALVDASRSQTTGPPMRDTTVIRGATAQAIASGLRRARCFGTSSPMITER